MKNQFFKMTCIALLALTLGFGAERVAAQTVTGSNALAYFGITSLATINSSALVNGDLIPVYQKSTDTVKAMPAQLTNIATGKVLTVSNTLTLAGTDGTTMTFPATSDTVAGLGTAQTFTAGQTFTGANTYGAASTFNAKTSTTAVDINPPFDSRILGNPVMKLTYGTCTIASINAKTCVILAGVTGRTISVEYFDVVSAGTPATCTGVLLEDNNGTPVVVATMNVAQLGSGVHDIPLTAGIGVGFGAGTGLTQAKGLQLDVNGSSCITATAMTYAVTYTVQ